ncbi:hypothetical protein ABIA32_000530 [Streptacidiphilus sp. MAP12-20]|uniref:hypothetical protein n=1 Tax=Streptacidiphilus sp. MAP12-20 TaxID=3156299 RepID=UPI003518A1C1
MAAGKKQDATGPEGRRAKAAAARAEAARHERRRRMLLRGGIAVAVAAVIAGAVLVAVRGGGSSGSGSSFGIPSQPRTTAEGRTTLPPWSAPADAAAAVKAAGLPMLSSEGSALHIHAHLDVYTDGKATTVPADIGIDVSAQQLSPLHTHDESGVIHVESPVQAVFSLGQFVTQWQVSMAADHIGGLKTDATHSFSAYVNGTKVSGDPAAIILHAHDEIALVYGTAAENAAVKVPSSYAWPSGL